MYRPIRKSVLARPRRDDDNWSATASETDEERSALGSRGTLEGGAPPVPTTDLRPEHQLQPPRTRIRTFAPCLSVGVDPRRITESTLAAARTLTPAAIGRHTDLKKITGRFLSKFAVKWIFKIPPHLAYVATLPCETLMSAKPAQAAASASGRLILDSRLHVAAAIYRRDRQTDGRTPDRYIDTYCILYGRR